MNCAVNNNNSLPSDMSQNKKITIVLIAVITVSAVAVFCAFEMLYKCINDIKYADEENNKSLKKYRTEQVLGKEIKNLSFINPDVYYDIAENKNMFYAYCENQYLEMSADKKAVYYFCYDRSVGAPSCGELECARSAISAVKECVSDIIRVSPYIIDSAFDGHQYVYYVSLGAHGGAIVRVSADSGKVALFDGRNINIL